MQTIIDVFLGAIVPIGLVAYLAMRLARRYVSWLRGGGRRWVPVLTLLLGSGLGAIPGLVSSTLSVAVTISGGASSPPITLGAGIVYGAIGGFLAPSIYAWVHKVILRAKREGK